jgi:cytochrome P450
MDTTSSALARILYLLAQHQPVQDRLRNEIRQARALKDEEQGEFGYDDLERLVYLDAVCRETMRLFVGSFVPVVHEFMTAFADTLL